MLLKDNIQRHQLDFMTTFNERKGAMISLWALHFWSLGRRYSEEVLSLGFLNIGFLNGQNIYLFRGNFSGIAWIPPIF